MEIGTEISQKIRAAIKTKLQELGSYVDDELPDYIMVMLANKRTQDQMTEDLNLFLGSNTDRFTIWLFNLLAKLQDVTSFKDSEADGENNIAPKQDEPEEDLPTVEIEDNQASLKEISQAVSTVDPVTAMVHQQEQMAPPPARKPSPIRIVPREAKRKSPVREELKAKPVIRGIQTEKPQVSSSVVKSVPSSSTSLRERTLKRRKLSDSDEEQDIRSRQVPSVVRIKDRPRPSIPASKQAPSMLLKKAVAEAQLSVSRLHAASSLTYDPTSPASPIHGYDHVEKQQKKRLLLQQHKELQKQLSEQGQLAELDTRTVQEPEPVPSEQVVEEKEEEQPKSTVEPQEPVIQLRVSEAEELELQLESGDEFSKGDTRIVAFADSQAGGDDSEEEQKKQKKRRAVKSREKPASPKFVVTLDGVDSDLEEKYDKEQKRRRRKKHRKDKDEFDEFVEVDTSDISGQVPLLPLPPQVLLPGMVPPLVLPPPLPQVLTPPPALVPEPITAPTVDPLAFKLNAASDDEGMDEAVDDKANEKCKFWPDCRNGDDCLFYHPTIPCRSFPNCRFGDSCLFIHPPCKFDGRCANPACPYTHKTKTQVLVSPVMTPSAPVFPYPKASPPPTVGPKLCKYHPACTNSNCPFYHPCQAAKQCRYGSSCTRTDCIFSHPPAKPASGPALKWVSPSLIHISERSFAVPEESVVSLPVK